jgi:protease PrsW
LNSRDSTILIVCFLISMLTAIPALVIKYTAAELGFDDQINSLFGRIGFSVFTGFIDELNKYIVIIAYAYRRREFDEPQAGIIVTLLIALGFVTGDNIWHILQADKYSDTWRIITSIPMSMLVGVMMGFYSGMSKYGLDSDDLSSFGLRIRGLVTAALFHGFYNFFLFMEEYKSLIALIIIGFMIVLFQVGLCIFRARRLHSRLIYSRMRRTKNGSFEN